MATAMAMVAMAVVATAAVSQYKTQLRRGRKYDEARDRVAAPHGHELANELAGVVSGAAHVGCQRMRVSDASSKRFNVLSV